MKTYTFLILIIFSVGLVTSCKHDEQEMPIEVSQDTIVPPADTTHHDTLSCDTTNIKYSVQIKTILNDNCLRCHGSTVYMTKGSGYNFDEYTVLKSEVDNGNVLKAIKHAPGAVPMPLDQTAKISDCEIAKIMTWISNGAPDN